MADTATIEAGTPVFRSPSDSSGFTGVVRDAASVQINGVHSSDDGSVWGYISSTDYAGWILLEKPNGEKIYNDVNSTDGTNPTPTPEAAEQANPGGSGLEPNTNTEEEKPDENLAGEYGGMEVQNSQTPNFKGSTRLFGCPHQFIEYVDPRLEGISLGVGHKFVENILSEAVIATIIPGVPTYLPGQKDKRGFSRQLLDGANSVLSPITRAELTDDDFRYFDFKPDYPRYMQYANILCRVASAFLDLNDIKLDESSPPLSQYKWQDYRYTEGKYESMTSQVVTPLLTIMKRNEKLAQGAIISTVSDLAQGMGATQVANFLNAGRREVLETYRSLEEVLIESEEHGDDFELRSCVQFYIEPPRPDISVSNSTSSSKLEGILDSASDMMKEIAFVTNSSGVASTDDLNEYSEAALGQLSSYMGNTNTTLGGFLERVIQVGSNTLKGENIVFPEIFQRSDSGGDYTMTINLKSPYGDRLSYYLNILVPLLHLVALAFPKQATANTYASPFLVKIYVPGMFHSNMGIVTSMTVNKNTTDGSVNVDGMPLDISVNLTIRDLYSKMSITSASEPSMFLSNGSLIDFLAVNCGLNVLEPQLQTKAEAILETFQGSFFDFFGNVASAINQSLGLDEKINSIIFMQ